MAITIKNEFKGVKKAVKDLALGEAFIFESFEHCAAYYIKVNEFQCIEIDPERAVFKILDIGKERLAIPVNLDMRFY